MYEYLLEQEILDVLKSTTDADVNEVEFPIFTYIQESHLLALWGKKLYP